MNLANHEGLILRPSHSKKVSCDLYICLQDLKFVGLKTIKFVSQGNFCLLQDLKPYCPDQDCCSCKMIATRLIYFFVKVNNFGPTTKACFHRTKTRQRRVLLEKISKTRNSSFRGIFGDLKTNVLCPHSFCSKSWNWFCHTVHFLCFDKRILCFKTKIYVCRSY